MGTCKTQRDERVPQAEELRAHYAFDDSGAKPNRLAGRLAEQAIVVVLDPDVGAEFTKSEEANQALSILISALNNPERRKRKRWKRRLKARARLVRPDLYCDTALAQCGMDGNQPCA